MEGSHSYPKSSLPLLLEVGGRSAGLAALAGGPGDAVSVQLVNSVELAISVLAIWELGAIYQPINPMYRKVECSGLLKSVNPKAVISSQANGFNHAELLDEIINDLDLSPAKVVTRSPRQGWHQFEALSGPEPHQPRNPLEHAIYGTTSGTTGSSGKPRNSKKPCKKTGS